MKTKGMTGRTHSIETKMKMSASARGNKNCFKSDDCNPSRFPEIRRKIADSKRGCKNPNWKGGVSSVNVLIRQSAAYREWKQSVLLRDDFTCQECGLVNGQWIKAEKKKVLVHADHIKQFAEYPELRLELSNGRTLCVDCHKKTDTFGFHKKI